MKEKYVKPALMVERFTLTQSIAASCNGVQPGSANSDLGPMQWSQSTCKWNIYGVSLFTPAQGCDIEYDQNSVYYGYCYNNPEGMLQMFSS